MSSIRGYLISLIAACMISVVASALIKQERIQTIVRFLGGMLIVLVAFAPLLSVNMDELTQSILHFSGEYALDTDAIENDTYQLLRKHIKETTQTYIEAKAKELGASVRAEVTLNDEEYPAPIAAQIEGRLSASQLQALSEYMRDALGIPVQAQNWRQYEAGE